MRLERAAAGMCQNLTSSRMNTTRLPLRMLALGYDAFTKQAIEERKQVQALLKESRELLQDFE